MSARATRLALAAAIALLISNQVNCQIQNSPHETPAGGGSTPTASSHSSQRISAPTAAHRQRIGARRVDINEEPKLRRLAGAKVQRTAPPLHTPDLSHSFQSADANATASKLADAADSLHAPHFNSTSSDSNAASSTAEQSSSSSSPPRLGVDDSRNETAAPTLADSDALQFQRAKSQQLVQQISSSPTSTSIIVPVSKSAAADAARTQPSKSIYVIGKPLPETQSEPPTDERLATAAQQQQQQQSDAKLAAPKAIGLSTAKAAESQNSEPTYDQMSGPQLAYSAGSLLPVTASPPADPPLNSSAASPRLFQSHQGVVFGNSPRKPSLPPPVNQANAASGFRSPLSSASAQPISAALPTVAPPLNLYQPAAPYAGQAVAQFPLAMNSFAGQSLAPAYAYSTANKQPQHAPAPQQQQSAKTQQLSSVYSGRRPLNITRVEHISAECSNDLIRVVIVFNGTFKGIIYSSGYVNDPTCLYVNGTGVSRYEFNIRLNECGTVGRKEVHQPTNPGEARRRDQLMWNTLSIQYNSVIEQEWDEHFKVSCEYGSDFWKTVSFSPFSVETSTGAPVVFTINPPQCQMDVLLGHGIGPKIAVDGPVTVGDPLTLLIHMKSEKTGYDILVKNCVAHNGAKQRMQLIDENGCVVNERFISPFRGTYNDNDLRHVTLYAYLKAFRFTGSPVLYLECEIHMCQNSCPPQMCYWRRLSKRSVDGNAGLEYVARNSSSSSSLSSRRSGRALHADKPQHVVSDGVSLFKSLEVFNERPKPSPDALSARYDDDGSQQLRGRRSRKATTDGSGNDDDDDDDAPLVCYRHEDVQALLVGALVLLSFVAALCATCVVRVRRLRRAADKAHSTHSTHAMLAPLGGGSGAGGSSSSGFFNGGAASKCCSPPATLCSRALAVEAQQLLGRQQKQLKQQQQQQQQQLKQQLRVAS